jgi:hypothetical protein
MKLIGTGRQRSGHEAHRNRLARRHCLDGH